LSQAQNEEWGVQGAAEFDEYKRIWLETDPILFSVTAVVTVFHSLFEWLALKNDYQFWKNKEDMEGISVRSIGIQIFSGTFILLYLLDNETSKLIWVPEGLQILFNIWKLKSLFKMEKTQKFPFFRLVEKQNYSDSDTNKYD
jgi:hypothetical protein